MVKLPPYLKAVDTIGIICPSGYMPFEKMQACIQTLKTWGYTVKLGKTAGAQDNYFSGNDEQRLDDLQEMLDNSDVKAILCARGGYGLSRIIDELKFKKFKSHPKWIIGYSDVTILQMHLLVKYNIASLHAAMAAAFNDGEENNKYIQTLQAALSGKRLGYFCKKHALNRNGIARGELIGGNLALLAHVMGTSSEFKTKNKILFLEDIGEYIYNIDRMMMQLKRGGKLNKLAGLIVGKFTDLKDTAIPFGQEIYDIIWDKVKEYDYPVCFDFPVGHTKKNYPLKIGAEHELTVKNKGVRLDELINKT